MKEAEIRKRAKERLQAEGWIIWYPYKTRYAKETDVFSIFDILAWREDKMLYIQLTTFENRNKRINKIQSYLNKHKVWLDGKYNKALVWAWHPKRKEFVEAEVGSF